MSVSLPKLVRLFLYLQVLILLVLHLGSIPLVFWVGFKFNLVSFWGCLKFVSHAFVCFIGSFESFKTRLGKLFVYPLIELFEIQWMS